MRILIVGAEDVWAIECIYKKYLSQNAIVEIFPIASLFRRYYEESILNKISYRLGVSSILNQLNKQLLEKVEAFKPDVIWVFKGMEVLPGTLRKLKEKNIFLANFNPDHPFIFSSRGSGNKFVSQSIPLYDLHFCYNLELKDTIESKYNISCAYLPFGYDIPESVTPELASLEEINKICFIGNPDKKRVRILNKLSEEGFLLAVYGNDWHKHFPSDHPTISIHPPVYRDLFWKTLFSYRLQLNIFRIHNIGTHNMRSFEIPAIGGIQLAPYSREHAIFFEEDEEIFLYNSEEELIKKASVLLSKTKEETVSIRKKSKNRTIDSGYGYKERALHVYKIFCKVT